MRNRRIFGKWQLWQNLKFRIECQYHRYPAWAWFSYAYEQNFTTWGQTATVVHIYPTLKWSRHTQFTNSLKIFMKLECAKGNFQTWDLAKNVYILTSWVRAKIEFFIWVASIKVASLLCFNIAFLPKSGLKFHFRVYSVFYQKNCI